jgi:hypothetical protein
MSGATSPEKEVGNEEVIKVLGLIAKTEVAIPETHQPKTFQLQTLSNRSKARAGSYQM